jgi:hypothetical protein
MIWLSGDSRVSEIWLRNKFPVTREEIDFNRSVEYPQYDELDDVQEKVLFIRRNGAVLDAVVQVVQPELSKALLVTVTLTLDDE